RVLARTPVTPKQQVLLVQVGKRVLVVADNGTQMSRLSEIVEADEVAALIGQLTTVASTPPSDEAFGEEFGKASQSFEQNMDVPPAAQDVAMPEEPVDSTQGEIKDLMQKVRGLARQLGKN